ncbi:uridine-preferring nucleoside hydrolase UriH [Ornithinimicrobium cryptoxanthini]|uniref:Nucleoside hydrolase n=1 Tax=Ornithinimicrobium cryptoxanthini TaxID=2934161 RepID=A0ABY4YFJ3_9MICO|nr:nucleoside hydrolase [Ornithinimicrobium cryptoxanthini]USQ75534.1 nucleoside hydrolase [Ornithinimicrobium cryptoxanthini]
MPKPRQIILDCDPGHDDAVAMMLALGNPTIELLGITTVGGNQTLEKVTRNAQSVLVMCGRDDVPVHPGSGRPLVRRIEVADDIHGESGLDGVDLPTPTRPAEDSHAVAFIIDTVLAAPTGTITLVATGPLTNLALAARLEPRIVERVREVVVMGGGYHVGNWTPVAEFNIWVDPEAAAIVFVETWPLTMVGLDVTHQALATAEVEEQVRATDSPLGEFFIGLMAFFRTTYREHQGFTDPPVHDACTIAYLIDPAIVQTRKVPLTVELRGEHTVGMTVADFRSPAAADCRHQVATHLDHAGFWGMVVEAITTLSAETTHAREPKSHIETISAAHLKGD